MFKSNQSVVVTAKGYAFNDGDKRVNISLDLTQVKVYYPKTDLGRTVLVLTETSTVVERHHEVNGVHTKTTRNQRLISRNTRFHEAICVVLKNQASLKHYLASKALVELHTTADRLAELEDKLCEMGHEEAA